MTFEEILNQAMALLQRQGRVSYRALKRQFDLDKAYYGLLGRGSDHAPGGAHGTDGHSGHYPVNSSDAAAR